MMMNNLNWTGSEGSSEEEWRMYFQLLLKQIGDIMKHEFYSAKPYLYDDPKDFINGFTLAGAFFSGLHLESDEVKRQKQIVMFRMTLAQYLLGIIKELERGETGV